MKVYFLWLCAGFFLYACGESPLDSRYVLEFPDIPEGWETVLGDPSWRVDWLNDEGDLKTVTVNGNASVEISLPQTCASAVSALPFWPDKGIIPGIFRPAGAIFPFDVRDKRLVLTWQGGIDANLFWELAGAYGAEQESAERAAARLPQNFDWPRFRLLFDDSTLNGDIRADPWLADWHGIAVKIVQSGFDKRRLVPEERSELRIPAGAGPWAGTSPFAAPLFFEAAPVFPVRQAADTWVCAEGILRCNTAAWIFMPYPVLAE